jgi:hypothetical protein
VGTEREIIGVKITKAREGLRFHGGSIRGESVSGKNKKRERDKDKRERYAG